MKGREEVARFIEQQMGKYSPPKYTAGNHYGWQHARALMDFIYEGEPQNEKEFLNNPNGIKG